MERCFELAERIMSKLGHNDLSMTETIATMICDHFQLQNDGTDHFDLEECADQFLAAKKLDGRSTKTVSTYGYVLSSFAAVVHKSVLRVDVSDIRSYLTHLHREKHLKDSSVNTHINVLKAFFSWLVGEGVLLRSPMVKIHNKSLDKRHQRNPLTVEELERIREACNGYREKAIVELYYSTGCRLAELAAASVNDIDLVERSLSVVGKGNKRRVVYFSAKAKYMLQLYLRSRSESEMLFCSERSPYSPLSTRSIQKIISQIGRRAQLARPLHPHLFRHTFATIAINSGMDITIIQSLMGHSDISTTQIYAKMNLSSIKYEYDRLVA